MGSVVLVLLLAGYVTLAWCGSPESKKAVGFMLTGLGGLSAAFGELVGARFGETAAPARVARWPRAAGFAALSVGGLLAAMSDLQAWISNSETGGAIYGIGIFVGVCVLLLATLFPGGLRDILLKPLGPAAQGASDKTGPGPGEGDAPAA